MDSVDARLEEKLGTPYYIAPEILTKNYGSKCDIWSCGVITYIVLCGKPPFNGESNREILKKVKIGKFSFAEPAWNGVSDSAKDFVTQLLTKNQDKRPTAEQALHHPFLLQARQAQLDSTSADIAKRALYNLQNFKAASKLKQATFAFIASQLLSKKEKQDIDKVFRIMDLNGDGQINKDELMISYK